MRGLRAALIRLAGMFGARQREQDLADEIESHIEMHVADNLRAGMTPEAARRDAMIRLGGIEPTKEGIRDRRGIPAIDTLVHDLRYAFRMLRKNPGFTVAAVLTFALGIGGNAAIFTVVDALIIRPLPYREASRLVVLWEETVRQPGHLNVISPANFARWRERTTAFDGMSALYEWRANLTGHEKPEELVIQSVTSDFFSTLGLSPMLGRDFASDEGTEGHDRVVILGYELWQRRFGGDGSIVGRTIQLNGLSFAVLGVAPPSSALFLKNGSLSGKPADLWMPFAISEAMRQPRGRYMSAVARVKKGVSLSEAQAQLTTVASSLAAEFPDFDTGWTVRLVPMRVQLSGELRPALLVLSIAVSFVLLIACANVANLLLARGAVRRREIGVRIALGAGRPRVIRQLLTESLVLGLLGGIAGILVADWGLSLLLALRPADLYGLGGIRLNYTVVAYTAMLSVLTSIVSGFAPALQISSTDPYDPLKDGGRLAGTGIRSRRLLHAFVVSQVALSVVLLSGAGLMMRSLAHLRSVDPGFNPENVLTARVTLPRARYGDEITARRFFEQAVSRAEAIPGVRAAGAISYLPFAGLGAATSFTIAGQPTPPAGQDLITDVRVCDNGYFRALAIPLLRGRLFNDREMQEKSDVVVVNQAMAREYFHGEDPIGKRILIHMTDPVVSTEIIGVVADVRHIDLTTGLRAMAYWPPPQLPVNSMTLVLRTDSEPAAFVTPLRGLIQAMDSDQPISDVRTMEQWVAQSLSRTRFSTVLLAVFAMLALVLAATGIYGVMSYSVSSRTAEIGIRTALGADGRAIFRMIWRDSLRLLLLGVGIGLPLAVLLNRALRTLLFETGSGDPLTYGLAIGVLIVCVVSAGYFPARRAAHIQTVEALRDP